MRFLIWLLRIVVFLLLLAFLSRNSGVVEIRMLLDTSWRIPLAMLMLAFFAVGVLLGVTALTATLLRQRREITGLKASLSRLEHPEDALRGRPRSP